MGYRPSRSRVDARHLARSRDPSLHMRIVGGSRRPARVALCEPASRTLSIESTGKQVLERELTCPSRSLLFAQLSRKTPFPDFSIKINHIGVQLCTREHTAARCSPDMRQLGHRGFRVFAPVVPPPCFREYFSGVHGHAWPFNAARDAFHLSWDSASTFLASPWTPGNFVAVASPIAAAIVFTTVPRLYAVVDVGRRPAIRNEKILRDFGFKIPQGFTEALDDGRW